MARFARLEMADGWYHVANRGAGRQRVFRNDDHRLDFLSLLAALRAQFDVSVHAYCLMNNRYDLVLHCQRPNLAVAMRHLGGVYTQHYNLSTGRDGPLFRGRYRSVLFEPETCLLAVTRRIHRRPLVTGTVPRLDRYRWSSYPSYVTRRKLPRWLVTEGVDRYNPGTRRDYRNYVEGEGESNHLVRDFYRQSRPGPLLGTPGFVQRVQALAGDQAAEPAVYAGLPPRRVLRQVAKFYDVPRRSLLSSVRGRLNRPRLAALWLCRQRCGLTLGELAQHFGMAGYGSVSASLHRIRRQMDATFWSEVEQIDQQLSPRS